MALENDKHQRLMSGVPWFIQFGLLGIFFDGIIKMLQRSEWQICDDTESRKLTVKRV